MMDKRTLTDIGLSCKDLVLCAFSDRERIVSEIRDEYGLFPARIKDIGYFEPIFSKDWLLPVSRHFGISPDLAEGLKEAIAHIDIKKEYVGLALLVLEIRKFLEENNLISKRLIPSDDIKRIIVVNKIALDCLPFNVPFEVVYLGKECHNDIDLFESADDIEKCENCYQCITKMLASGIEPGTIRVLGGSKEDVYRLKRKLEMAEMPFYDTRGRTLSGHPIAQEFVMLSKTVGTWSAFQTIKEKPGNSVINCLADLLNDYGCENLDENPELLHFETEKRKYRETKMTDAIVFANIDHIGYDENTFNLILSADMDALLAIKGNRYLDDNVLEAIGMKTAYKKTEERFAHLEQIFRRVPNLTLFMSKLTSGIETRKPEFALGNRKIRESAGPIIPGMSFSRRHDILEYAKLRDKETTYGNKSALSGVYEKEFVGKIIGYDPKFSGLRKHTIEKIKEKTIGISPSGMNVFFGCPYRFLIGNILRLEPEKENIKAFFGSLAHAVIANGTIDLKDMEKFPDDLSARKEIFMECFRKQIEKTLSMLDIFTGQSEFELSGREKNVSLDPENLSGYVIHGKIDRVMTKSIEGKDYYVIIDFKSGNNSFKEDDFEKGTDVQLPFYLYLENDSASSERKIPFGFFYQKILPSLYSKSEGKDSYKKKMELDGRIISDMEIIESFSDISWIRGVSLNASGGIRDGKRNVGIEYMDNLMKTMEKHINAMTEAIDEGKFTIIPQMKKVAYGLSAACRYCQNRPLCHLEAAGKDELLESEGSDDDD